MSAAPSDAPAAAAAPSRPASDPEKEVDILDPELLKGNNLSDEQKARIAELQAEIEEIWTKKGNYEVDDEAWKTMPLFMNDINEQTVEENEQIQALQHIKYEEVDPKERAEKNKAQGNKMLVSSLNPEQTNFKNFARSAVRYYTEALICDSGDRKLTAVIYGNRSMAHFVLENFGHGMEDAQKAIVLDKDYTKAYYRGAKCAEKIRKFDTARQLIDFGLQTSPPPIESAVAEFKNLLALVEQGEEASKTKVKKDRVKSRSKAADSSQLVRRLQNEGITVNRRAEVSSEQWAQLSSNKPYFDEANVLHVPVLLLYDEYSQTDFAQDVACDCPLGELIEEMLPPPWDDKGRYQMIEGLCVFYKIDDGVAMPKYYRVDPDWQLFEILRTPTYEMPLLVPTFHVVPEGSDALKEIKFEEVQRK